MNYDNKSEYAINKATDDIVYLFMDGTVKRYRKENGRVYQIITDAESTEMLELPPREMSVPEFDRIKAISNSDYHERELHEKRTTRENVPIENLMEANYMADRSAEQEYIDYLDSTDTPPETRTMENAMAILDECLTETQKRRYIQYHLYNRSTCEIAEMEQINQKAVWESLNWSEKKILKYFLKISKNNS